MTRQRGDSAELRLLVSDLRIWRRHLDARKDRAPWEERILSEVRCALGECHCAGQGGSQIDVEPPTEALGAEEATKLGVIRGALDAQKGRRP